MELTQFAIPLITLICGWVLIYLINLIGTGFSRLLSFSQDNTSKHLLSLFFGYLTVACIGSFYMVGFHTIFSAVFALLLLFLYQSSHWQFQRPVWFNREWAFQILVFTAFAVFRLILVFNAKSSAFHFFFLDDYYYQDSIAAISSFGEERKFSELLNKAFDLPYFYSQYHYFTFSLPALLRTLTGINVYYLFHFFLVPFVQMLAFCGLFYISLGITKRRIIAVLIALIGISSLRYSLLSELVASLPFEFFLQKSVVLKGYYGFQFLNSGFGLKFCISLFLISVFLKNLDNKQMVSFSAILLYINPLFIVPFLLIQVLGQYYAKVRFSLVPSLLYLVPLIVFVAIQKYRPGEPVLPELMKNIESVFQISLKSHFMSVFGYFFNEFYAIFLLPWVLVLFLRKNRYETILSLLLILYPVLESCQGPKVLTLAYIAIVFLLASVVMYRNMANPLFTFLLIIGVLILVLMPFSQLMPNFNQIFLLIVYPGSLLFAVYLISVLVKDNRRIVLTVFLIVVSLGNLFLNFRESMARRIPITATRDYAERVRAIVPKTGKPSVMGIYDSKVVSISYINQYFIGEEIQLENDLIFPVFVNLSSLESDSSVFEANAKEIQPFQQFSRNLSGNLTDDTKAKIFCQKFNIPFLLVKEYDCKQVPKTKSLYTDSIYNERGKYWIFYRGKIASRSQGL